LFKSPPSGSDAVCKELGELHLSLLSPPLLTVTIGLSRLFPSYVLWLFAQVLSLLLVENAGLLQILL